MENEEKPQTSIPSNEVEAKTSLLPAGETIDSLPPVAENPAPVTDSAPAPKKPDNDFFVKDEMPHAQDQSLETGLGAKGVFVDAKKKKKVLFIVGVILMVVLVGLGIMKLMDRNKSGSHQTTVKSSTEILESSFAAMKGVNSYAYDGSIDFYYSIQEAGAANSISYKIRDSGVWQQREEGPAAYSSIDYSSALGVAENKSETFLKVETVSINGKKYLRLGDLKLNNGQNSAKTKSLQDGLKQSSGNWYSISEKDSKTFYDTIMGSSAGSSFDKMSGGVGDLSSIFADTKLVSLSEDLGSEAVGNKDTMHYRFEVDTQEALSMVSVWLEAEAQKGGKDSDASKLLGAFKSDPSNAGKLTEMTAYILKDVKMEVWIGKSDDLIYRFKLSGSFDKDYVQKLYEKIKSVYGDAVTLDSSNISEQNLTFDVDYTLSGFNASEVRQPQNVKDFSEVLNGLSGNNAVAASVPGASGADSDNDGLTDEQEKFYGTDAKLPDTDGDGYKDGDEVKNGFDPAIAGSARLDYSKLNKTK